MKLFVTGLLCLTLSTLAVADTMSNGIFQLINQRLSYMQDVALFKARNHRVVEDLTREQQVLEKACEAVDPTVTIFLHKAKTPIDCSIGVCSLEPTQGK